MSRTFIFTYQNCCGKTGGGQGVVYRLYEANLKYTGFEDAYFIFGDRIIHNKETIGSLCSVRKVNNRVRKVKKLIPGIVFFIKKKFDEISYYNRLKNLDEVLKFSDEDYYIFHDHQLAYQFLKHFNYRNTVYVYHTQGSIYNEWSCTWGRKSILVRKYYNNIFKTIVSRVYYICFPSKGAKESLVESEPETSSAINKERVKYLYNGVSCDIRQKTSLGWIKELKDSEDTIFTTIATLNSAKAVERIPKYLKLLKEDGYKFKWVLVGDGVNSIEVKNQIEKNKIEKDVLWIKEYMCHDDVLSLLEITDFYILLHKYSIFDLSTLEAMHYGSIPLLSPVGGNKEIIIDNNGLFINKDTDIKVLEQIIDEGYEEMKKKNKEIQNKHFSEEAFLTRYKDLIDSM